jgi:osmotically inducible lipoprotein OsmB
MKTAKYMMAILTICSLSGCAGMTRTQQTTLSGGAIGAAGGAALGAITGGNAAVGAAVGGAAGALGGYIIGESGRR